MLQIISPKPYTVWKGIFEDIMQENRVASIITLIVVLIILGLHFWKLGEVPKGLYSDESAIGLNAWLIASKGVDEYNRSFPLYFESFGEFKNPLYIYSVALVFKVLGPSPFSLRLTSAIFLVLFLLGCYWLGNLLFNNNPWLSLYLLIAGGTLPWFFTYSRISFEAISQITIIVFALVFIYKAFHANVIGKKASWIYPLLAGSFVSASIYAYTTSRLLTYAFAVLVVIFYLRRSTIKQCLFFLGSFFIVMMPYAFYSFENATNLTKTFLTKTYIFDPDKSIYEKAGIFFGKYFAHLDPGFLFFHGDSNLRHSTSVGGELYFAVAALFLIALPFIYYERLFHNKFVLLLFSGLLVAPVASSFTFWDTTPHATRSLLVGLFVLVISGYGFMDLARIRKTWLRSGILVTVFLVLIAEASIFSLDYFQGYAQRSIVWFESHDFEKALQTAYSQNPKLVILSEEQYWNQVSTQLKFHLLFAPPPENIEVRLGPAIIQEDTCLIIFTHKDSYENPEQLPIKFISVSKDSIVHLKCA